MDELESIYITDDEGKEHQMLLMCTFMLDQYGKNYAAFYDPEDEEQTTYLYSFDEENNMFQIEDDQEWETACEALQEILGAMEDYEEQ